MRFDVVLGNPPYQKDTAGHGAQATPLYDKFIDLAIDLAPRYLTMIVPSRWFFGGYGLASFRARMLSDRRLRTIVDYTDASDAFPGVEIKGGVNYFLWDASYDGDCSFSRFEGSGPGPSQMRDLRRFDVLIRDNAAQSILDKIGTHPSVSTLMTGLDPFSLATNFAGDEDGDLVLYRRGGTSKVRSSRVSKNQDIVGKHKVLLAKASDGSGTYPSQVISRPVLAGPGSVCTMTYFVAGAFDDPAAAQNLAAYLRTRFVRYLVSLRKSTQDTTADKFAFVPLPDLTQSWTDEQLTALYGLSAADVAAIQARVKL